MDLHQKFMNYRDWCYEQDQLLPTSERCCIEEKQRELQLVLETERFGNVTLQDTHWKYPEANCYIPIQTRSVPSLDETNLIHLLVYNEGRDYRIRGNTNIVGLSTKEYQTKYCTFNDITNRWEYK